MPDPADRYRKNPQDEEFLRALNDALAPLEHRYRASCPPSGKTVIFLCGAPRSGTTLLSQILAHTGIFLYIDNFVARFWRAPRVGMHLGNLLGLKDLFEKTGYTFDSEFGRTHGLLDPHEFSYFWDHWLGRDREHDVLGPAWIGRMDVEGLRAEVNALVGLGNRHIFFKNMVLFANPGLMNLVFPASYFVVIRRDIIDTALSIYHARMRYFGSAEEWFSTRPAEYQALKKQPVEHQIIGQIKAIYREFDFQSEGFRDRVIEVSYDEVCAAPYETVARICEPLGIERTDIDKALAKLPREFTKRKNDGHQEKLRALFEKALSEYEERHGDR